MSLRPGARFAGSARKASGTTYVRNAQYSYSRCSINTFSRRYFLQANFAEDPILFLEYCHEAGCVD
jgi:hypothetical protein